MTTPNFQIEEPNYTEMPNILLDEWLPHLKETELKVLLVIYRKTFGWHKTRDQISLSQLEALTGLSRQHIIKGTNELIKKKIIQKTVIGPIGSQKTIYDVVIQKKITSNNVLPDPVIDCNTPPVAICNPQKKPSLNKDLNNQCKRTGGRPIFISIKERVKLTQKQYDELLKSYGKEALEWMLEKLSTYKVNNNQEYSSDFKAINRWVVNAWKNETNRDKANQEMLGKNLKVIKEIQETLEHKQKRGILTIDENQARDTVLGKSCSLFNLNMPQIVAKWYGWEWKN